MTNETLKDRGDGTQVTDNVLYVVGPSKLQNSLMASFLAQTTGAKCQVTEGLINVPRSGDADTRDKRLVLLDWLGREARNLLLEFHIECDKVTGYSPIALFNLSRGLGIEEKLLAYGVEGFFYELDSMENLVKGVRAILGGELWVSRTILTDYMRRNSKRNKTSKPRKKDSDLTPREIEVLLMIATGAKNAQIAERLFISPHTVRTHVYKIYRKIGVENRFEAILWTIQNM
jgi:DNA-binding CsgD family transcriptional regulator